MSDIEVSSVWQGKNNEGDVLIVWANKNQVHYDYLKSTGEPIGDVYDTSIKHFLEYFEPKIDMVNEPPHYKSLNGVSCTEVVRHMMFFGGSCFKYLYRAGKKGSTIEDLKKAKWYAERAWIGNEQVSDDLYHLIADIAHHRSLGVSDVMMEIARSDWYAVGWRLNDEIIRQTATDRLESE